MKSIVILYTGKQVSDTAVMHIAEVMQNFADPSDNNLSISCLDDSETAKSIAEYQMKKNVDTETGDSALIYVANLFQNCWNDQVTLSVMCSREINAKKNSTLAKAIMALNDPNISISPSVAKSVKYNKMQKEVFKALHDAFFANKLYVTYSSRDLQEQASCKSQAIPLGQIFYWYGFGNTTIERCYKKINKFNHLNQIFKIMANKKETAGKTAIVLTEENILDSIRNKNLQNEESVKNALSEIEKEKNDQLKYDAKNMILESQYTNAKELLELRKRRNEANATKECLAKSKEALDKALAGEITRNEYIDMKKKFLKGKRDEFNKIDEEHGKALKELQRAYPGHWSYEWDNRW